MSHSPSDAASRRVAKWIDEAKPLSEKSTWTEQRLAIDLGGHTYIVNNGQVFQCAHCGHYDPEWSTTEVLAFFKKNFDVKPYDITVTCTVAVVSTNES